MCHCPAHADRSPSLSVRVGERSLLFKCFAGCPAVEIIRALRAMRLNVPVHPVAGPCQSSTLDSRIVARAREIWECAGGLAGTPGEAYLRSRAITSLPAGLRWHPRTPLGKGRAVCFRPAIIAAVEERNRVIAVQRLFIDPITGRLAEDLVKPKLALGRPLSGAVRLRRPGTRLGLAEGVESAESAAILLNIPVWAALGSERLHQIAIPSCVEKLILLPDNDAPGRRAERLAPETYASRSFAIETSWPWRGLNDWNDVLRQEEERVNSRMRNAG